MAAPTSLRIVRRPGPAQPPSTARRAAALVAASQPIEDPATQFRKLMSGGRRMEWQEHAWEMFYAVGELRFYVGWRAASASRVRLIASEVDDDGVPTGSVDPENAEGQRVAAIVRSIAGGAQGQARMIKRVVECLSVPGEAAICILFPDRPDPLNPQQKDPNPVWAVVTPEEVTSGGQKTIIELPDGSKHEYQDGKDGMFRVWDPDPRRARLATSPVRSTMDSLREIVRTTKTISNASKSRLIGNGVVFVPHEMSLPAMGANVPTASNKPGVAPTAPIANTAAVTHLQELLFEVAKTAYDDEDSMAALIPLFAAAPGELIKNVTHIKFDNTITETAINTRNDAIKRLAMGLDVSPERLLGVGSNSNHWSAWQIGDDDVRLHILPPVELLCQALTEQVLYKVLAKQGIDPRKYVVWHDASQLTIDPDKTDEAKYAFDQGAITAEALIKLLNLPEDSGYDFANGGMDEWARWARDELSKNPDQIADLSKLIPELSDIEFTPEQPALPQAEDGTDEEESGAGRQQEPDTEDDAEDGGQQAALTDREATFAEAMIFRGLEIAGKRRRTRQMPYELRQIPDRDIHRHMDPVPATEVGRLIAGYDAPLTDPVVRGLGLNPDRLRRFVRRQIESELTKTLEG